MLNQLFSILGIAMVTLTATATSTTRTTIIDSLHMEDCTFVIENTDRPNIRYTVLHTKMDVDKLFKWLLDDIIEHGKNIPKLLVFLQSKPQCTELYSTFKKALGSAMYFTPNGEPKDDRTSIIGMYHHGTGDDQKESALKSFTADDEYPMRILFCTSSFGLGVNVKNCHDVIHLGPPKQLDEYIQESGRVGRDGLSSHSILLVLKDSLKGPGYEDEVKSFVKNESLCRRKMLMDAIENTSFSPLAIPHTCCDVCARNCTCLCSCQNKEECSCHAENTICTGSGLYLSHIEKEMASVTLKQTDIRKLPIVYRVEQDDRDILDLQLREIRKSFHKEVEEVDILTSGDVATGFTLELINNVVSAVEHIGSLEILMEYFPFFNESHACKVFESIQCLLSAKIICSDESDDDCIIDLPSSDSDNSEELSDGNEWEECRTPELRDSDSS